MVLLSRNQVQFSLSDSARDEGAICDEEYRHDKPATCDNDEVKDSKGLEQREQPLTLEITSIKPYKQGLPQGWVQPLKYSSPRMV